MILTGRSTFRAGYVKVVNCWIGFYLGEDVSLFARAGIFLIYASVRSVLLLFFHGAIVFNIVVVVLLEFV